MTGEGRERERGNEWPIWQGEKKQVNTERKVNFGHVVEVTVCTWLRFGGEREREQSELEIGNLTGRFKGARLKRGSTEAMYRRERRKAQFRYQGTMTENET